VFECAEICRQLLEVQAAQQIQEASQLANAVQTYLSDPMLKNQTGANGRLFVEQNRGTLKRLLTVLDNVLR
jgi:3-deoxy-D-manno-octulosonic-acid transferase